jgi:phosphatidylserine/phosphatidylglycerophosphate/cardiolipin synthase-like enzyme
MFDQLTEALNATALDAFGLGMPVLSPRWIDGDADDVSLNDPDDLTLTIASGSWVAPIAGSVAPVVPKDGDEKPDLLKFFHPTLTRTDGQAVSQTGLLLSLFPHTYLRLSRLYARVLEQVDEHPVRPVPYYFYYETDSATGAGGHVRAGETLEVTGKLSIFDRIGLPIDPLAVASAFKALMEAHNILQRPDEPFTEFEADSQVAQIAGKAEESATRLWLVVPSGSPYDGTGLSGLKAESGGSGLFTLDDEAGAVTREDDEPLFLIGPTSTGRLGTQFSPPAIPPGLSLARDFFSLRVVEVKSYLSGILPANLPEVKWEAAPFVRPNEQLNLLVDGNDLLGAVSSALSEGDGEKLCVAQMIRGDFQVPATPGEDAHFPAFPPLDGLEPAEPGPLPYTLGQALSETATAAYADDGSLDVVLRLEGLPPGAAVRAYSRRFIEDAREARGNGAGGIVAADGRIALRLPDPLSLRERGLELPLPDGQATLRCDLMVVKRTGETRMYGNVDVAVGGTAADPTPPQTNFYTDANRRGVSNAEILGLSEPGLEVPLLSDIQDPAEIPALLNDIDLLVDVLIDEDPGGGERVAPRLPTMSRRDLIVAGQRPNLSWRAVVAAGRLAPEMHSASPNLGSPGGLGGRETQATGLSTQNGRLAYDLARAALRRTNSLPTRLAVLNDNNWDEPPAPAPLPDSAPPYDYEPGSSSGSYFGAVLQNVAPSCETPYLSLLTCFMDLVPASGPPTDLQGLMNWLRDQVNTLLGGQLPDVVQTQLDNLINELESLVTSDPAVPRVYEEIRRELSASAYGLRQSQWALRRAIADARRFIYIETPGFAATYKPDENGNTPDYAVDLIAQLAARINQAPGLHVIICVPKNPDFSRPYSLLAQHEVSERQDIIKKRLPESRVVSFHPIGFPGRSSRVETTTVIVDDLWALVGSSTFRRRGLAFDGSTDLVFTDSNLEEGRSPQIAAFRRQLLANRLGVAPTEPGNFGEAMASSTFVRLDDGVEAFYVVREMLREGGSGRIARLWNGRGPNGLLPVENIQDMVGIDMSNPDGRELDLLSILGATFLGRLGNV